MLRPISKNGTAIRVEFDGIPSHPLYACVPHQHDGHAEYTHENVDEVTVGNREDGEQENGLRRA